MATVSFVELRKALRAAGVSVNSCRREWRWPNGKRVGGWLVTVTIADDIAAAIRVIDAVVGPCNRWVEHDPVLPVGMAASRAMFG